MRNSVTTAPVASEALTKFRTPRKKKLKEMSNVFTPQSQPVTKPQQPSNSPHKRKSNNKNDKGLKWFKGTHKKSSQKFRLLKSTAEDFHPPPPSSIAAKVVEFEIDGTVERLGVTERLDILDKESLSAELLVDLSAKLSEELANTNSPSVGRKPRIKSDKVKVKSKKNGKVQTPSIDARLKDTSTTADVALPEPSFRMLEDSEELGVFDRPNAYIRYMEATQEELSDEVEYDLEEEDIQWLQLTNAARKKHGVAPVKERDMEFMMDRLEKESYFQMQSTGMDHGPPIDDDAVCCICMDGECQNSNAILFCDMCNLAVHQDCYGVPYIPEGQWLCRKCLHSPSRAVECVLCPNKGGALKGTDDGRWAHVACAIWIPEVCFANTVFLEPIESISNIPAARWRLTCFICKQKGIGACIQCYKSSCYTAFHVTCAQQANLVMKMETVREMHMTSVIIKKTAYCNNHAPPELLLEKKMKDGQETSSPRMKMKQTRKILAEKRDAIPAVLIPTIPKNRIAAISNSVNFPGKPAFMKKLMAYWKLKRNQRNGVPLLRRLQMASTAPNSKPSESFKPKTRVEQEEQMDHYKSWVRLRQDLERARLLCEMIRKREKLKRELIYVKVKLAELELCPMKVFFLNILDEIGNRDTKEIFHHPVDVEEVNDYLTKVKHPMDLSTMRSKVNAMEYTSLEGLEGDFNLMIANCLLYNDKDTVYYKTALRIRAFGAIVFRKAKKTFQRIGYDGDTGLHCMPGLVKPPPPAAPTTKTTPTKAMSKATPTKAASAVVTPTKVTSIPTPTKGASALVTPTKATSIPTLTKTVSTTASPSKASPSKATPTKGTPTKSSPNKGTPSKTTPNKGTPSKATPTKGTPKASSPPKATSIICSELVTCKCSNSSVCNNNCKKNSVTSVTALPLIIPASFTTYRSGGGGVDSDSDDETNRTKGKGLGEDDELEESESESCSGSSSRSSSSASGSDAEDEKRLGESDAEEEDEVRSGESDAEEKSDESDASSIKDKREDQDETYSLSETSDEDTTPVRNTRKQEGVVTRRTSCQQMKASEARTRRGSSSDESDEEIERIRAKTKTRTSGVITRNSNHQVEPMSTPPPRRRRSLVRNSVSTSVVRSPSITSLPFLRRPPPPRPQANDSDGDSSSASSSSASSRTGKDEDDEDEPRKKRLRKRK